MTEDSRTLEQRIDAGWNTFVWHDGTSTQSPEARLHAMSKALEAGGLPDLLAERDAAIERAEQQRALIEILHDMTERLINFDGGAELMSWQARHQLHADEPYIGCPFCRDAYCLVAERDAAQAAAREMADAIQRWLSETGPGQHVNTMKGRSMARRALDGFLEEGSSREPGSSK